MTATAKTRTKPRAKKEAAPAPAAKPAAPAGPAIEFRSLDSLIPYARNARTHSAEQVAQLAASLVEFGFTNPVLADSTGIVAGHGRVLAARQLYDAGKTLRLPGGQPVPAGAIPVLDCTGWTEAQRRAYILADNQLAATSGWDFDMLAVEIDDLRDAGFDVSLLGFSREELNDLIGTPNLGPDPLQERAEAARTLASRFMVPPFSTLNAREGWWQERKRAWIALGIRSELGRGGTAATPPHPPTVTQNADGTLNYGGTAGQSQRFDRQRVPNNVPGGGSPPPAADYSRRQRGAGNGRPL